MPNPLSSSDNVTAETLSDAQKAEATAWFPELEKEAEKAKWNYMACRVPAALQEMFIAAYPNPDAPPAPPPAA